MRNRPTSRCSRRTSPTVRTTCTTDPRTRLAIVRLDTEVEAARVGESLGAFAPVFSTVFGRSSMETPPTTSLSGDERRQAVTILNRLAVAMEDL